MHKSISRKLSSRKKSLHQFLSTRTLSERIKIDHVELEVILIPGIFDRIPREIENEILLFLDWKTLVKVSRVCKRWHSIIQTEKTWKRLYHSQWNNELPLSIIQNDTLRINDVQKELMKKVHPESILINARFWNTEVIYGFSKQE
jgi:hypothetical protein